MVSMRNPRRRVRELPYVWLPRAMTPEAYELIDEGGPGELEAGGAG